MFEPGPAKTEEGSHSAHQLVPASPEDDVQLDPGGFAQLIAAAPETYPDLSPAQILAVMDLLTGKPG